MLTAVILCAVEDVLRFEAGGWMRRFEISGELRLW